MDPSLVALPGTSPPTLLFGGHLGWNAADWTDSDDRVRGGSSQSYLRIHNHADYSHAVFTGNLDTETLGGAGFASQRTLSDNLDWDLSSTHGIALTYDPASSDDKIYTFILKDTLLPPDPSTGREQSTVSWEYDFRAQDPEAGQSQEQDSLSGQRGLKLISIPWDTFKPTYRGREVADPGPLKTDHVKRVSIMMRSFFDTQSGPFKLDLVSIGTFSSQPATIPAAPTTAPAASPSIENDCESMTSTLQGEDQDEKGINPSTSEMGDQGSSTRQGFWSWLMCR